MFSTNQWVAFSFFDTKKKIAYLFVIWDLALLCDQAGLWTSDPSFCASQTVELQACITTPSKNFKKKNFPFGVGMQTPWSATTKLHL